MILKLQIPATLVALLFLLGNPALARPWAETIDLVERKSEEVWERGRLLGGPTYLGTALNEVDVPKHKCAILGRMLDLIPLIEHLEYHPEPVVSETPTQEQLYALMVYAQSLSNWVHTARRLSKADHISRMKTWNLDCAGKMEIPESARVIIDDGSAKFRTDGESLLVLGNIERGFSDELKVELERNPTVTTVLLGSGGGNVLEAMQAGLIIRGKRLSTTLSNGCYSACPLVFLGGVERSIWSPYPTLGFHKLSDKEGREIHPSHSMYNVIFEYVVAMGADPNFVLASILRASPAEMFEPNHLELCQYYVTTWVQRLCFGGDTQ